MFVRESLGFDRKNGVNVIAEHRIEYYPNEKRAVHYIDGTKRADIPEEGLGDYAKNCELLMLAIIDHEEIKGVIDPDKFELEKTD